MKFRVPAASAVEIKEKQQVAHDVQEDRKHYLQALIVRIMKAKKQSTHQDLVHEIVAQSRHSFSPDIPLIKTCIDLLLEKEYLERKDRDVYYYVN